MTLPEYVKDQKGTVFIIVMVVSMLMILIAVSISNILLQDAHMIRHIRYSTKARYLAEAGVSDALSTLSTAGFSTFSSNGNSLGEGTYDVSVSKIGTRWLITSTGTVHNTEIAVSAEVKNLYPEALNYAFATGDDITIKAGQGDVTIKGNIHANEDMLLKEMGQSTLLSVQALGTATGKATSCGSYDTIRNVSIADPANSGDGKDPISLPTFDFATFKSVAEDGGGNYIDSDHTFNGDSIDGGDAGITYVDGDVIFKGDCDITGGFVASGDITLNNQNSIDQSHAAGNRFPIFMCGGEAKLYGNFNTNQGNVVYATNDVDIRTPGGGSTVLGCVISGGDIDIVAEADTEVTYSKIVADEIVPEGIEIVSWNR